MPVIILCLAVAAIVLWTHWPVLSAKAVSFDDEEAITRNHLIQTPGWQSVKRFFGEVTISSVVRGYYRPLTLTSFMLDWAMGGRPDNFRPFHRTSLALHLGSTLLLVLLCYQIFGNPWAAAMAGLLFGVHPLTVEPIAWVMERKTVLCAFFAFAALNAYVRYTRRSSRAWYGAAVILFLMSLLAKPTSTPLPLIALLMDRWPLERFGRRAILEKIPFLILSAVFAALACICEQRVNPLTLPAVESPLHLPLRTCYLVSFYFAKILLPIRLSSVYLLPAPLSLGNGIVLLTVGTTVLLVAALVVSRRWTPAWWVGASMFLIGLAPTMGLVGYSWVEASDKYTYFPAVGLVLIVAWFLARLWAGSGTIGGRRRAATVCVVLAAAALLAAGTREYLRKWESTDRLLAHMLSLAPHSAPLHSFQGGRKLAAGHYEEAIQAFTTAINLAPAHAEAYYNRGLSFATLDRFDQAVQDFGRAIEIRPVYTDAYINRGNVFGTVGEHERALADYRKAIELDPNREAAYLNRARVYTDTGQFELALSDIAKAIELVPLDAEVYHDRGNVFLITGDIDRAIRDYTRAIELKPDYADAFNNRGNAWMSGQDYARALEDFSRAIALQPDNASLHFNLGVAYAAMGDQDRAIASYARATELDPGHAVAFNNRGNCHLIQKDYRRAIEDYTRAIAIQPDYANAYANLGKAYADSRDLQQAILNYTRAIELNPKHAIALANRAEAYYQLRKYDQAWADVNACRQLGGTPPPTLVEALTAATGRSE
ncbi:MAG TPA: tetratricopeptide repeat protein [Phycisphaerae bacterium]|nr:tetratricopeptide repeat protein [Phycisphaerae bacterium]